jgi:hypothetical protein
MLLNVSIMQPQQSNPYDFLNEVPQQKRGLTMGGNSQKARALQVGIIAVVILIIGFVIMSLMSSGSKTYTQNLLKLAAAQQDITDLTKLGSTEVRDAQLARQSAAIKSIVLSQNVETLALLNKSGAKKPAKDIALLQVKTYTKNLDEAKKNGNYDEAYTAILANRIDDYRVKLQATYSSISDPVIQKQFSDYYQQLEILAPAPTSN